MRLKGKTAVVTGAGRGIGRAISLGFAAEGANVVLAARTRMQIDSVARRICERGGNGIAIECDVADEERVKHLIQHALAAYGKIDILVNNAGVATARPVWGLTKEAFEEVVRVNLVGSFLCIKHVWRPMREAGGGTIINVASLGGMLGYSLLSAYCASKWGQIGLTKSCAEEGKPYNIRVNAIAPGRGDTGMREGIREDKSRMLRAEDHVGVCIFLACDESRFITGQVIPIEWFGSRRAVAPKPAP